MAWPSPSEINWSDGGVAFLAYLNTVTLGWVSRLFLIGIYVIVLTGYYKARDDFAGALGAAGIATFVVAFIGWLLEPSFIDWITLAMSIGVMFVGVAIVLIDKNQGTS